MLRSLLHKPGKSALIRPPRPCIAQDAVTGTETNYEGHIPLDVFQRGFLAVASGIGCMLNPRRADLLTTFGETSGQFALQSMYKMMFNHPDGVRILRDRPRIRTETINLPYLRGLPGNTLGKAYVTFLDHYNYSPDERHLVRFVDDPDLAYVMLRYREIHDLVHTLLEQPTDMLGEVVVKWVEGLQTGLPMCLTGGFFGSLRLAPRQSKNYLNSHLEYALRVGLHSHPLMCVYFEEHWEDTLDSLRSSLLIPPPPIRIEHLRVTTTPAPVPASPPVAPPP